MFWSVFFTVFFETADLRSYCAYFLAICQLCFLIASLLLLAGYYRAPNCSKPTIYIALVFFLFNWYRTKFEAIIICSRRETSMVKVCVFNAKFLPDILTFRVTFTPLTFCVLLDLKFSLIGNFEQLNSIGGNWWGYLKPLSEFLSCIRATLPPHWSRLQLIRAPTTHLRAILQTLVSYVCKRVGLFYTKFSLDRFDFSSGLKLEHFLAINWVLIWFAYALLETDEICH